MIKKSIYTIGYTLFKNGNTINIEKLFDTLKKYNVDFLVDVRSVPYSKQYPQCNAEIMKNTGKKQGVPYINMPEIGAKASNLQDVFSKAKDIFLELEVFPIAKSYRPEKTKLLGSEEIVDFSKFINDEYFIGGLNRIKDAYDKGYILCLMCSEKKPIECHRYFLISKALEQRFGDWIEVKHLVENLDGSIGLISNMELDTQLEEYVCHKKHILSPIFKDEILENYHGNTEHERINDFCYRYWNLIHGWKKNNYNIEDYD